MKRLAEGVWQLKGFPPDGINVYLVEDVLIDAATRRAGRRILKQLEGRDVTAHALTHAHSDHQGASDEVCGKLGIPYWMGGWDVPFAEDPRLIGESQPPHPLNRLALRGGRLHGHRRARPLAGARGVLARVRRRADPGVTS